MFTWKLEWEKQTSAAFALSLTKYFISVILSTNKVVTLTEDVKQC
jgi:hypothetical protein